MHDSGVRSAGERAAEAMAVLKHFHTLLLGLFLVFNATSRAAASEPWFDEAALERAVVSARIQGTPEVVIPPGVHRMSRQVNIRAVENLVIDGQGATLLFTSRDAGLHIASARGLTLKNLTIDYDPLPFTQGTIVNIDPSGKWYDVRIDPGYPQDDELLHLFRHHGVDMMVMDPQVRAIKAGTPNFMRTNQVDRLTEDVLRLWFPNQPRNPTIADGDPVVLEYRSEKPALTLIDVSDSLFENLTIHSSSHMGILELQGGGGNIYRNVRITPGPPPQGALRERLFSVNADAFHSGAMERGPLLENCLFEMMGDDGINIKGSFVFVVDTVDSGLILASRTGGSIAMDVGDTLQLVDGASFDVRGNARLTKLTPTSDPDLIERARRLWQNIKGFPATPGLFRAEIEPWTALRPGDLVVSLSRSGQGAVIRGCTIRGNRARGMLVRAPGARIENNTLANISIAGITVMPESEWMEGPIPFDVVIKGNLLTNMGISDPGYLVQLPHGGAAIAVLINDRSRPSRNSRAITNVTIEENVIRSPALTGIQVYNTTGAVLRNNEIWQEEGEGVRVDHSTDVQLVDNRRNGSPLALPASPGTAAAENLVQDGGFETFPAGAAPSLWELWEREPGKAEMRVDDTASFSGSKSLFIHNTGTEDWSAHYPGIPRSSGAPAPLPIGGSQALYVSVAIKIEGNHRTWAALDIQQHSSPGEEPQSRSYLTPASTRLRGSTDWIVVEGRVLTHPDTVSIRIRLSGGGPGKVWFDDVIVRPVE